MAALDFPSSPTDGQIFGNWIYSSATGAWQSRPVEVVMPAGIISQYAGTTAPTGYLMCDGQAVSRTTYAALFTALGTNYGTGDGSTTFNLPDLQGRVPVGKNGSGTFASLNAKGGAETHTLSTTEMPSHTHTQNAHSHTGYTSYNGNHAHNIYSEYGASGEGYFNPYNNRQIQPAQPGAGTRIERGNMLTGSGDHNHGIQTYDTTASNQNTGGGGAHNNLQPYIVVNYIIKT